MPLLELSFASKEDSLSVRRFAVREAMSSLFEVSVVARSPNEDIDLEAIVGKSASFFIASRRRWGGVCSFMEQEQAEETGLSTYHLRIVPSLWLLTHRRNHRVFQHLSAPEIIGRLLDEWGIDARWNVQREQQPRLEYRVQYGESDFVFLCRILEEAGISFAFSDEGGKGSELVFSDAPHMAEARPGGPVRHVDHPNQAAEREFVTKVRVSREVRPGKITIRDHDFRRKADYRLAGDATAPNGEARLEQYHYRPGAFVVEGHKGGETPVADARGVARADERVGKGHAEALLATEEARRSRVAFRTNVLDLRPGVVFSIANHPRAEFEKDARLLVTALSIEGPHDGEWTVTGQAVFTTHPYRPARETPRPHIHSVEGATVVGPPGEEIHTDEFGRVRVQFHWDREGGFDEHSSCWMRVSQGWAGGAYGMMALPRVGQEVLVSFLAGDPDQPIIVGRVYNNTTRVPYKLPENKTVSTWKSSSSPGFEGSNEIMFEDAKGAELVYVQAERNLEKLVKVDESITIGHNRCKLVTVDEAITVGGSRTATIGSVDEAGVGVRHAVTITSGAAATGVEMVDRRISWTTGEATLTLEGPNITLDAAAAILLKAASDIVLEADANITANATVNLTLASGSKLVVRSEGGDVVIQGGPIVRINPERGGKPLVGEDGVPISVELPPGVDLDEEIATAEEHARFDRNAPAWFAEMTKPGGAWDYGKLGDRYAAFSNFHHGVMGKAMGFPEGVLLRHAGLRRKALGGTKPSWGDPGNGVWGGAYPYGAESKDQEMMKKGFAYYDKNYA